MRAEYRISEDDDVLAKENYIHGDIDARVAAIEAIAEEFRRGNRVDVDALLASIQTNFAPLADRMDEIIAEFAAGFPAALIVESPERRFLTASAIAELYARQTVEQVAAAIDAELDPFAALVDSLFLRKADNLAGLADKAAARASLDLRLGIDVQAYSAFLASLTGAAAARAAIEADGYYARLDGSNTAPLASSYAAGVYTVAAPASAALTSGRPFRVRFATANPVTPVNLVVQPSGGAALPARRIRRFLKGVELDLLPGDIANGIADLVYDGAANAGAGGFILLNPQARPVFGADKGGVDQAGILSATVTKITFGNELYDLGGLFDPATSRVQPPFPCRLRLGCKLLTTAGNAAGAASNLLMMKNGNSVDSDLSRIVNTNSQTVRCDGIIEFNGTTDYVEFYYSATGTGDKTVSGSPFQTNCYGFMVG